MKLEFKNKTIELVKTINGSYLECNKVGNTYKMKSYGVELRIDSIVWEGNYNLRVDLWKDRHIFETKKELIAFCKNYHLE